MQGLAEAGSLHTDPCYLPSDHQGLLTTHARTPEWPYRVPQFRARTVGHPRCHRLLHVKSIGLRLHGEPDLGAVGLSGCQRHHRSALSHQHRDVPGHESEVSGQMFQSESEVTPASSPRVNPANSLQRKSPPEFLDLGLTFSEPHCPPPPKAMGYNKMPEKGDLRKEGFVEVYSLSW